MDWVLSPEHRARSAESELRAPRLSPFDLGNSFSCGVAS